MSTWFRRLRRKVTPSSEWFVDTRSTNGHITEIGIVRVMRNDGRVSERRVMNRMNIQDPGYRLTLDNAMDQAYQTIADLNRR